MVMTTGLSPADLQAAIKAACGPHRMRRNVTICTLDHSVVADVTSAFVDGQVNIAASSEVSRSATVTLFDPTRSIGIDKANPAEGTVAPKYLLRLSRGLYVDALARWVDFPLGMLAFTKPGRVGDLLSIEAQGKESLAQLPVWQTLVLKKGTNKASAIRTAMSQLLGEKFFRISSTTATLTKDISIGRDATTWAVVKEIADGMGWSLFYDAEGYLVARPPSTAPVFLFRSGPGGSLASDVTVGFGSEVYNRVLATGATPKGKKAPREATAALPPIHPLSAASLARGGVHGERRYDVSSDDADTAAKVQSLADRTLAQVALQSVEFSLESLPLLHIEEDEAIGFEADDGQIASGSWSSASIPLSAGLQSNGYNRRVSRSVQSVRGIR